MQLQMYTIGLNWDDTNFDFPMISISIALVPIWSRWDRISVL